MNQHTLKIAGDAVEIMQVQERAIKWREFFRLPLTGTLLKPVKIFILLVSGAPCG